MVDRDSFSQAQSVSMRVTSPDDPRNRPGQSQSQPTVDPLLARDGIVLTTAEPVDVDPSIDRAKTVAEAVEHALTVENPHDSRAHLIKELAYRTVALGESLATASASVGLSYATALRESRNPAARYHDLWKSWQAYWFATVADGRRAMYREVAVLVDESVLQSARNVHTIVHNPKTPLNILADVSNKTLDRGGVRAPDRVQQKIEIELSEDTIARMVASRREVQQLDPDQLSRDFAYAYERPQTGADAARQLIHRESLPVDPVPVAVKADSTPKG